MSFSELQERARELLKTSWDKVDKRTKIDVPAELLPLFERLVVPSAHPHTLLAIATADTVIMDQEQRGFGNTVIRFVVLSKDGDVDLTPLPGTKLELDIVLIKHDVKATITLVNESDTMLRHEFLVEDGASLTLLAGHINATGTYTRQSTLLGPGASLMDREFLVGNNSIVLDNAVIHSSPHTKADVSRNGVVLNSGSVQASGMLRLLARAQKSESFLSDHWMLLSKDAVAKAIPSLEVEANDVKASHSASVRPIDEAQLFYLQSRGIGREEARGLIVKGFIESIIKQWPENAGREALRPKIDAVLEVSNG
jgi:hypothetical protein